MCVRSQLEESQESAKEKRECLCVCVYLLASWQLLALICYDASSVFAVVVMAAVAVAALGFILLPASEVFSRTMAARARRY